ncbi:MAG TPA: hypothetical protein VIJ79_01925 [Acidobacteriaceae bacterium]
MKEGITVDGSAGFIVMIVAMGLFFCALIGGIVWLYSSQSAKRQKATKVESRSGNGK